MRKRLSSKLLAVILTVAICATTVFGCLMTVNAADSCYSFNSVEVSDDLTEATIGVTFKAPASLPNGFIAGAFSINEVDADAADKLTIKSVSGSGVSAEIEGDYVVFNTDAAKSIATVQLTFGFSKGTATKGKDYKIQLSGVELAYNDSEYYVESATGAIGKISTECEHVIGVVGEPLKIDTANNYSVYENSVCTICGEEFGIQLVPTAEKLNADGASYDDELNVVYITYGSNANGEPDGSFMDGTHGTGTETDPYVISTPGQLRYLAQNTTYAQTHGKFFEIDDSIDIMVLQSEGYINTVAGSLDAFLALDAEGVKAAFATTTNRTQWQSSTENAKDCFAGTLNGNGVKIVGAYNQNGGIIAYVNDGATAKNITVEHCMFETGWFAGSIFGYSYPSDTLNATGLSNENCPGVITFDNITVHDNYTKVSGNAQQNTGALFGDCATYIGVRVNGCLVYDCKLLAETAKNSGNFADHPFAFGDLSTGHNGDSAGYYNGSYTDSVFIGCVPFAYTTSNQAFKPGYYSNVYTNCSTTGYWPSATGTSWDKYDITFNATVTGAAAVIAMPNLDWGQTWLVGADGEYPYLAAPDYVSDTICWDGTVATGIAEGSGSDTDPFIINSVPELAYVVALGNATEGKYYKIADGIKNVVLQKYAYAEDIMALDSALDVQAYFESGNIAPQQWIFKGWAANAFSGKFDGNGATIYGLYSDAVKNLNSGANHQNNSNPALFPAIDAGAEFSNIAIKNSYVYGKSGWNAGIFASIVCSGTYGNGINDGVVKFDNCAIVNNYFRYTGSDRGAIFFSSANGEVAEFSNCLVYGNDAADTEGSSVSLAIGMKNSIKDAEDNWVYASYKNSVILGVLPYYSGTVASSRVSEPQCYSNVYTDAPAGKDVYTNATFSETQLKQVSLADALGTQAKNAMPNLAWGTDWYCGAYGEPPVLAPFATLGASDKSTFAHQLYGSSVTYNNDGTLDFNLHFVPQYEGIEATLYVGTADTSKFYKLTATESSYRDDLGGTALMFTLPNISARDIDKVWLPTLVVEGGEKTEWGKTQPVALVDNAMGVLAGDYDAADKQVSAALINYNVTADDALSVTTKPSSESNVVYVQYGSAANIEPDGSFMDGTHGTGTETDPYVISTPGQLRYLAQKSTYETTHGKFFEIDENIDILCLQSKSYIGDINKFMTKSAEEVMTFLSNATNRCQWQSGNSNSNDCFSGTLDGNGVTIVGMYTSNGGLFNVANEGATFKNITVSNSYISAGWYAGAILGSAYASETYIATIPNNTNCYGVVSFENITVNDNYILNKGNAQQCTGALVGAVTSTYRDLIDKNTGKPGTDGTKESYGHIAVYASNILTYDNSIWAETASNSGNIVRNQTLFGKLSTGHNGMDAGYPNGSYDNIVTIDCVPFAFEASNQAFRAPYFRNVYSGLPQPDYIPSTWYAWNQFDITFVDAANLTGAAAKTAMPGLDWVNTWTTTDGYPALINKDYKAPASGVTVTWDGTVATGFANGTGSKEDPYIISTAAEFAYMVKDKASYTPDKYFKVADGISAFVMQKPAYAADIMALNSAADTKAYFEANAANMLKWPNYGWEGSCFAGTFDGNGATVYGLYQVSTNNAGLFSTVDAGTTIKNIAVKNSYLTSTASNYQVAAIAAVASGDGYGVNNQGIIWFDRCVVANNYMYNASTQHVRSGLVFGVASYDTACFDNCLVYGNDATYGDGFKMALVSSVTNGILSTTAKTPEGLEVKYSTEADGRTLVYKMVRNTVVLGSELINVNDGIAWRRNDPGCYVNCYTDGASGEVAFNNGTWTYTDDQVKYVNATDALGADAKTNLANLGWAEDGTGVWYVGAAGDMPGFKEAGAMPTNFQAMLNGVTFTTPDTVGAGTEYYDTGSMKFGVYQTALSLKANPYMSFAFAFGGDYKTNRDKIKIRFTYTENGALTTSNEISVPAYTGEDIKNVNGWTNTTANGRFHTFKADMIPVEALAYGIKVEVNYNNTGWKDFGTYSVEGLGMQFDALSKTQPGDYYSTRVEAAKALLFYAQAIAARYGAQ